MSIKRGHYRTDELRKIVDTFVCEICDSIICKACFYKDPEEYENLCKQKEELEAKLKEIKKKIKEKK